MFFFFKIRHHQAKIKTKTCNKILFKFCPASEHVQQLKHRNNIVFTRVYVGTFVFACTGQPHKQTLCKTINIVETHTTPLHTLLLRSRGANIATNTSDRLSSSLWKDLNFLFRSSLTFSQRWLKSSRSYWNYLNHLLGLKRIISVRLRGSGFTCFRREFRNYNKNHNIWQNIWQFVYKHVICSLIWTS